MNNKYTLQTIKIGLKKLSCKTGGFYCRPTPHDPAGKSTGIELHGGRGFLLPMVLPLVPLQKFTKDCKIFRMSIEI